MTKISRDINNNLFLLKICFKNAKLYTWWYLFDKIRNEALIFLKHTIAIRIVLHAVEFGRPFGTVAPLLVALFFAEIVHMMLDAYRIKKLAPKTMPVVYQKLKEQLFAKSREMDLASFDDPRFYNDYIMAVNESDKQLDRALQTMENMVSGITRIVLTGVFFIAVDPITFIFVMGSTGALLLLNNGINKLNFKVYTTSNPIMRKMAYVGRVFYLPDYAKELRLNPEVADRLQHEHKELNQEAMAVDKKYATKRWILSWLKNYVFNVFVMAILYALYLGYSAIVLGRISIGDVAVFFTSARRLRHGLEGMSSTASDMADISRYVERIKVFLNKKSSMVRAGNKPFPKDKAIVELRNVSFRYTKDEPYVLKNVNIVFEAGKKVAIVGYNGAGKSTLVKLIMRLYDPTEGEVLLNGINIKSYNVDEYRHGIGVIFQDYKIFAATVKENVLLDTKDGEVIPALEHAGFSERLASLPHGLDTQLTTEFEEDGVNLSGGEAQKVAIARAFYKDAALIILDEPSSALDPIAEYQFNRAVAKASGDNKTMIFISHRLSTTRVSDKIFLLDNGEIAEFGTHNELISKNGKYARMWEAQTARYTK